VLWAPSTPLGNTARTPGSKGTLRLLDADVHGKTGHVQAEFKQQLHTGFESWNHRMVEV